MQIKEFCEMTGLGRDTVRFYEKQGLIAPKVRANGYREYGEAEVERVREVQLGQMLGFTLREIRKGMEAWRKGRLDGATKVRLMEVKLGEVSGRIGELKQVEKYLKEKIRWMRAGEKGAGPRWMKRQC